MHPTFDHEKKGKSLMEIIYFLAGCCLAAAVVLSGILLLVDKDLREKLTGLILSGGAWFRLGDK